MQKPSKEERAKALYGATCIHASFGDVEIAQTTLRGTVMSPERGTEGGCSQQEPAYTSDTKALYGAIRTHAYLQNMDTAQTAPGRPAVLNSQQPAACIAVWHSSPKLAAHTELTWAPCRWH